MCSAFNCVYVINIGMNVFRIRITILKRNFNGSVFFFTFNINRFMQRGSLFVKIFNKIYKPAFKSVCFFLSIILIFKKHGNFFVKISKLTQSFCNSFKIKFCCFKNFSIRFKCNCCSCLITFIGADLLNFFNRNTAVILLKINLIIPSNFRCQPL